MAGTSNRAEVGGGAGPRGDGGETGWRADVRFAAEIVSKLAIPLLTVAATVLGIYVSNTFKQREMEIARENNLQALQNQREQSETALRSAMFRELVGPLLQTQGESAVASDQPDLPRAQRLALLAELLTLNFHEHFELGPMLRYVDNLPGQTDEARSRLRSTARRVVSRQLAPMLSASDRGRGRNPDMFEVFLTSDPAEPADEPQTCFMPADGVGREGKAVELRCTGRPRTGDAGERIPPPLTVVSPDGRVSIQVVLRGLNWKDQSIGVYVVVLDAEGDTDDSVPPMEFTLSPYSLPFSDNTLLPSGNRFGLYIVRIDDLPDVLRAMMLRFVWFPKDFVPPRERPYELDISPADLRADAD